MFYKKIVPQNKGLFDLVLCGDIPETTLFAVSTPKNKANPMETHELTFFGGTPPVTIHADNCRDVVVNYRLIIHHRDDDTLRKWANQIDQEWNKREIE